MLLLLLLLLLPFFCSFYFSLAHILFSFCRIAIHPRNIAHAKDSVNIDQRHMQHQLLLLLFKVTVSNHERKNIWVCVCICHVNIYIYLLHTWTHIVNQNQLQLNIAEYIFIKNHNRSIRCSKNNIQVFIWVHEKFKIVMSLQDPKIQQFVEL